MFDCVSVKPIGPVRPFNPATMVQGNPCKKGHDGLRYIQARSCVQCASDTAFVNRKEHKEYIKVWEKTNKDKVKRYKNARKGKAQSYAVVYRAENVDSIKEYQKAYRQGNPRKSDESKKKWAAKPENKIKKSIIAKNYRETKRDKILAYAHTRRARKRDVEGKWTAREENSLSILQENLCHYCYADLITRSRDHYVALTNGGTNHIENIRLACASCNSRKHTKSPAIWEAEINWKPRYTVPTLEMYEAAKNLSAHPLNPFIVCDDPLEEAA